MEDHCRELFEERERLRAKVTELEALKDRIDDLEAELTQCWHVLDTALSVISEILGSNS